MVRPKKKTLLVTYDEAVGRVVKRCRRAAGVNQQEMAEALDITPSALSRIESGKVPLTCARLKSFADRLELSPKLLIEMIEAEFESPWWY